jgi:hypothetical protein
MFFSALSAFFKMPSAFLSPMVICLWRGNLENFTLAMLTIVDHRCLKAIPSTVIWIQMLLTRCLRKRKRYVVRVKDCCDSSPVSLQLVAVRAAVVHFESNVLNDVCGHLTQKMLQISNRRSKKCCL